MKNTFAWIVSLVSLSGAVVGCAGNTEPGEPGTGGSAASGGTGGGSGGSGSGGTGGSGTGGSGTGGIPNFGAATFENGLGHAGDWEGYLWSAASKDSTISPANFEESGAELCVSGVVGPSYEEWGMIGWNIAQDIDPVTSEGQALRAVTPGGVGLRIEVNSPAGNWLRVQLNADDTGGESWCAEVPEGGKGVIPWTSFEKECWAGEGEAYDPQTPIMQVTVQAPGPSETSTTDFDYCVIDLGAAESL